MTKLNKQREEFLDWLLEEYSNPERNYGFMDNNHREIVAEKFDQALTQKEEEVLKRVRAFLDAKKGHKRIGSQRKFVFIDELEDFMSKL